LAAWTRYCKAWRANSGMPGLGWRRSETRILTHRSSSGSIPITDTGFDKATPPRFFSAETAAFPGGKTAHNPAPGGDKKTVSAFLRHAEEIFAAARTAGPEDCDMAILVNRDGGIHMIAGADWDLEPMRLHYGASAAYRVNRNGGQVRLEARRANESCTLLAEQPVRTIRRGLADFPQYLMVN
jgi:hypothetical protein